MRREGGRGEGAKGGRKKIRILNDESAYLVLPPSPISNEVMLGARRCYSRKSSNDP